MLAVLFQVLAPFTSIKKLSLYQCCCMELFRRGFVMWRVIGTYEYVLLLNNYDYETGDLMVCQNRKIPRKKFSLKVVRELNLTSGFRIDDKTQCFYFSVFFPFRVPPVVHSIMYFLPVIYLP